MVDSFILERCKNYNKNKTLFFTLQSNMFDNLNVSDVLFLIKENPRHVDFRLCIKKYETIKGSSRGFSGRSQEDNNYRLKEAISLWAPGCDTSHQSRRGRTSTPSSNGGTIALYVSEGSWAGDVCLSLRTIMTLSPQLYRTVYILEEKLNHETNTNAWLKKFLTGC